MRSAAAPADFERALEAALTRFAGPAPVSEMIRYHVAARADRRRARLVFAACEEEGGDPRNALEAACAIEIVHDYARLHLDIADGCEQRMGRPTVWRQFGRAHGINTGDALCAIGFLTVLAPQRAAAQTAAMMRVLHEANLAMCAAHSRALQSPEDHDMERAGTAALTVAACRLGAIAAGAPGPRVEAYGELGRALQPPAQPGADAVARRHGIDRSGLVRAAA